MADDGARAPSPFDVQTIKYLTALMSRHDLSEIDLSQGDQRIRLRRGPRGKITLAHPAAAAALPAPTAPAPAPATPAAPATAAEPARPGKKLHEITSPTPGTFYAKASPDAAPYVQVGARVKPDTVVCLIEAMKIFNEITADCSGVVTEVLAEDKQAVEFGQVLFRVDTSS